MKNVKQKWEGTPTPLKRGGKWLVNIFGGSKFVGSTIFSLNFMEINKEAKKKKKGGKICDYNGPQSNTVGNKPPRQYFYYSLTCLFPGNVRVFPGLLLVLCQSLSFTPHGNTYWNCQIFNWHLWNINLHTWWAARWRWPASSAPPWSVRSPSSYM